MQFWNRMAQIIRLCGNQFLPDARTPGYPYRT